MPIYTFINKKTKKELRSELMSISEMEQYLKEHPKEDVLCGTPGFGDSYRMGKGILGKVDNEFKDRLREIKKNHRGSTIDV